MKAMPYARVSAAIIFASSLTALGAEGPATFKVSEFTFTRPANWEWMDVSASPMRKAQLKINGKEKDQTAEVVFYYFGEGGGGGTQANVDRWFGQFQEPKDKIN